MGVLGLWKLIDATGKPVPLETLEGKVLAIDISIWIHQVIQGYQDRRGNTLPNAHLIGLFNRICKLFYFKIKPVFVFDGGVPLLKKNTIATRRKLKSIAASKAQKLKNDLINNLIKHTAVKGALEKGNDKGESSGSSAVQQFKDAKASGDISAINDMYKLPEMPSASQLDPNDYISSEDEDELSLSPRKQTKWLGNIHSVDVDNEEFKNLPADVRYDILTDLKETRKQNSWGRLHELPTGSNKYSGFQVKRLLKRRYVQESLEVAEKEMGGKTLTLEELDRLLTDQGIDTTLKNDEVFRIASDSTTRVIYVKDSQSTQSSKNTQQSNDSENSKQSTSQEQDPSSSDTLLDSTSIKPDKSIVNDLMAYDLDEDWNSDEGFETTFNDSPVLIKSSVPASVMNPALAYMLENSGLTRDQILKIVQQRKKEQASSDASSSRASSVRSKKKKKSLHRISVHKRKLLFDTEVMGDVSPKRVKEVSDAELTVATGESGSESDDFVEVSEKVVTAASVKDENEDKMIIKVSSDDEDSDDFVEVQDVPVPELLVDKKPKANDALQIMIKADEDLEDDIFADVFSDVNNVKKLEESPKKKLEFEEMLEIPGFKDALTKDGDKNETPQSSPEKSPSSSEKMQSGDLKKSETEIPRRAVDSLTIGNLVEKIIDSAAVAAEMEVHTDDTEIEQDEIKEKSVENLVTDEDFADTDVPTNVDTDNLVESVDNEVQKVAEVVKEPPIVLPTDEKELESMRKELENEQEQITGNLGKLERQAIDITDQMRIEAQELLKLFGVPYIVAPMEAEAQCAYLEQVQLTDGTITDDSDVWLFGGHCVYKNFFDNNKRVLRFLSEDIEHHFKLSRKEMIQLAILVGSDYTNGLAGVGPVTALEILASFPCEGEDLLRGLRSFSTWFRAGKLAAPGKIALRNKLKNVQIEKGFPSQAVAQAYLSPTVDESKEPFTWGKPNLTLLADYTKHKFGWTKLKFDEIMNPVMKRFTETQSQKLLNAYFKVQHVPKSIEMALSKRVHTAIQRLGDKHQAEKDEGDEAVKPSTSKEKVKKPRKATGKRGKKSKDETGEQLPAIAETAEDENKDEDKTEQVESISEDKIVEIKEEPKLEPVEEKCTVTANGKGKARKIIPVSEEFIPQRERDKVNALKTKLKAIEIYRKSKKGLDRVSKKKKVVKKIKEDAELSESSSD